MNNFIKIINKTSKGFAVIAGVFVLISTLLVLTEVAARGIFHSTIYISEEYSAYLMVAITFLGLAYTLKEKGHIRVTFLNNLNIFQNGKPKLFLEIYSYIVGLIIFLLITIVTAGLFWDSVITGTQSMQISQTYLAIPQFIIPLGSLIITLQFLAEIFNIIINFRSGTMDKLDKEDQTLGR